MEENLVFRGELQLLAWGESMQQGAWVKFQVHPDDLEAFKLLRARAGKTPGQRLGVAMIMIADDETVVEHKPAESAPGAHSDPVKGPAVRLGDMGRTAVIWCGRPDFQRWCEQVSGLPITDADDAKEFILDECGVTHDKGVQASRKHLDMEPYASLFLAKIFHPFVDYAREHHIDLTQKPPKGNP